MNQTEIKPYVDWTMSVSAEKKDWFSEGLDKVSRGTLSHILNNSFLS